MVKKQTLLLWLGILVSVAALYFAVRAVDVGTVADALLTADWRLTVPILIVYWVHFGFRAWRWRILLYPIKRVGTGEAFGPMMLGFFGNNVLPAHMGEFLRMFVAAHHFKVTNAAVLATLVVERVLDMVAVAVLFGLGIALAPAAPEVVTAIGYAVTLSALGGAVLVFLYARFMDRWRPAIEKVCRTLPEGPCGWLLYNLDAFGHGLLALKHRQNLGVALAHSMVVWVLIGGTIHLSLMAVADAVPVSASLLVLGATVFAVTLPAAPGFFGSIQLAFLLALKPYAISADAAIAASVVFHVITYVSVTVVGLYYVGQFGLKWRAMRAQAEQAMVESEHEAHDRAEQLIHDIENPGAGSRPREEP